MKSMTPQAPTFLTPSEEPDIHALPAPEKIKEQETVVPDSGKIEPEGGSNFMSFFEVDIGTLAPSSLSADTFLNINTLSALDVQTSPPPIEVLFNIAPKGNGEGEGGIVEKVGAQPLTLASNVNTSLLEQLEFPTDRIDLTEDAIVVAEQPIEGAQDGIVVAEQPIEGAPDGIVVAEQPIEGAQDGIVVAEQPIEGAPDGIVVAEQPIGGAQNGIVVAEQPIGGAQNGIVVAERPIEGAQNGIVVAEQPIEGTQDGIVVASQPFEGAQNGIVVASQPFEGAQNGIDLSPVAISSKPSNPQNLSFQSAPTQGLPTINSTTSHETVPNASGLLITEPNAVLIQAPQAGGIDETIRAPIFEKPTGLTSSSQTNVQASPQIASQPVLLSTAGTEVIHPAIERQIDDDLAARLHDTKSTPTVQEKQISKTVPIPANALAQSTSQWSVEPPLHQISPSIPSDARAPSFAQVVNTGQPVSQHQAIEHISRILAHVTQDQKTVTVRLDPPDLGRVTLEFQTDTQRGVTAIVSAENIDISQQLRDRSDVLLRSLKLSGFESVNLQFNTSGNHPDGADSPNQMAFENTDADADSILNVTPEAIIPHATPAHARPDVLDLLL